ncbi:MAG: aminomethyl-transferring glycine dehydrogenase subunit GcvPA [Nitrososphaeria archaeon]
MEKLSKVLYQIGINEVGELYRDIPEEVLLKGELNLPEPLEEMDLENYIYSVLEKNRTQGEFLVFLGGGLPPHYVPATVDTITSRSEFYTAYTPYQPEISQGMLQALFEYQSMICDLTGMDVANSSMYDWATAVAEAIRMAIRVKGNKKILVGANVGPERKKVIRTYLEPLDMEMVEVKYLQDSGRLDLSDLEEKAEDACCLYIENPNFFGVLEKEASKVSEIVHAKGGLFVVGADPISLALVKSPSEYGADIVVGEGQILGGGLNFGGPALGIFACKSDPSLVRQIPGRIIGMTTDLANTQRAFTMVLQTREQHIRREHATSNICSNEALMAVGALTYLALLGSKGLRKLALETYNKAHYASKVLSELKEVNAPYFSGEFFQEFAINFKNKRLEEVIKGLVAKKIVPGIMLESDFPELKNTLLSCFTEVHKEADIDIFVKALKEVIS